ncbi:hypothetical protein PQC07_gp075 [Aeromonas phage D3]|uniref:Uncharacterized protein n=3 Tax=Ludhianavirus TaxID=3044751 RepID=A0A514A1Q7_9CAUD|nr:hypothetical protein PQC06_gp117 [Aeromonas phage LAh10]YP_010668681.1 hypothetical protein PQC07_gp075 [Aeromonas phage D3]YP_010668948.1 hypothetical protein PQC08_gp075 [Aeromonas phage D6]QDH47199.1 hypothetical protein LAh10_117 [Aeromonas phage LAh10]QDJ96930.1 hypothetical protein D3_0200 [Aeromonas phage D3]QDJ97359.1 hypothetical protein D6_0200 [Aeromonas phage D6]
MTVKIDALNIFDTNDIFSLVFESRNREIEDGTILKSDVAGVKTTLHLFDQKGSLIIEGSIGHSTILIAHVNNKWLMYMNKDTNTLPAGALRKQRIQYFNTVMKNPATTGTSCETDDWDSFAGTICRFIKDAR